MEGASLLHLNCSLRLCGMAMLQRALSPFVEVRKEETTGVLLMFAYSFLAFTAYNIIQPLTRSKLIASLGAVNVPWVIFGSGLFIGVLMLGYALLGILLISQFWTLANGIYDPRQAKRIFGFIGGGVMLGGMTGAGLTATIIETVGANTLLLWSALTLLACMAIVAVILGREHHAAPSAAAVGEEER